MAKQKSRFPSYGLVRGPSHEHGGVAGMVADEQPVELEGGEWIIPKEVVPDYLPVLKQITNEGRAMQRMDTGNTAMDALIASASMETGLSQPKSPMYQEGGVIDVLKEAMSQYGGEFDESLYTPEGGRTKLGYAKERGLTPESVAIDTLYFENPGDYEFLISGKTPSGVKLSGAEKGLSVAFDTYGTSKYDEEISKWRGTPLKGDVSQLISDKYGSLYDSMKAHKDFDSKIESAILPKGTNKKMLRQAKIMVRGGMEPDIDRALASLVDIEKNRGAIDAARETAKASAEKQMMMKALGMNEKEYDDFQAMKARLGKRNYNTGGPVYGYQEGGKVDYSKTSGLYNRFLAELGAPEMMGMKDVSRYRALHQADRHSHTSQGHPASSFCDQL